MGIVPLQLNFLSDPDPPPIGKFGYKIATKFSVEGCPTSAQRNCGGGPFGGVLDYDKCMQFKQSAKPSANPTKVRSGIPKTKRMKTLQYC
eukprot:4256250-Amphidinium_carterae.1